MLDTLGADVVTVDPQRDAVAHVPVADAPVRWNLATRIGFRFAFLYFGLYVVTTQMLSALLLLPAGELPNLGATGIMKGVVSWTATHVFHPASFVTISTGSGDKIIDWVHAFCLVVISTAVTAIWSVLDRRRDNYIAMHKWFHLFLRFAVGTTMVGYGMVKAIPLQMPAPSLQRLLEPY